MKEDEQLRRHLLESMVRDSGAVGGPSDSQALVCVICLDEISEHAITQPCAHGFDFVCIVNWLERNATCPLCKSPVSAVEYDRKSWRDFKVYTIHQPPPLSAGDEARFQTSNRNPPHGPHPVQQAQLQRSAERQASPTVMVKEDPLVFRKHIYRHQLYSLHIGSNRLSHFEELTPKRFIHDAELTARARKWIRRELRVFDFLAFPGQADTLRRPMTTQINAEYLLEWIVAMLKSVEIKGSNGQAEDMLQEFLGRDNARLFLHELRAWLRSPYSALQEWDRIVQYREKGVSRQCIESRVHRRGPERRRGRNVGNYAPYPDARPLRLQTR